MLLLVEEHILALEAPEQEPQGPGTAAPRFFRPRARVVLQSCASYVRTWHAVPRHRESALPHTRMENCPGAIAPRYAVGTEGDPTFRRPADDGRSESSSGQAATQAAGSRRSRMRPHRSWRPPSRSGLFVRALLSELTS